MHFTTGASGDGAFDPLWEVAVHYQELKRKTRLSPTEIRALQSMAVEGILRRTLRLIRHFRRKTRLERVPWTEARSGEIALIETLERAPILADIKPEDIIVETRREKPLDLVMVIDTSLSMDGRKLALSAVGAAVLALRLRAESYSVVAFGSTARVLKPLGRRLAPRDTILRILDAPMLGYTNISAGLARARAQLRRGRAPLKATVLLTDGKVTEGPDPEPAARLCRRLEILMTHDHNMDQACCHRMAAAARQGHVTEVRRYQHLPEKLLELLRALQK